MAFGSSVLTHKKEQQIKIEGEFKPTVDCLCATRRRFVFIHKGIIKIIEADGCVNNVPKKPRRIGGRWSVLDRLHIKQAERRQKDNTPQQEQERSRKS